MNRILILIFVLLSYFKVEACKCVPNESLKSEFDRTEIVISGKVAGIEILEESHLLKINFEIGYVYKGIDTQKNIIIYTPKTGAACGYTGFQLGKEFIVFLSKVKDLSNPFKNLEKNINEKNIFWTTHCTQTNKYTKRTHSDLCGLLK